MHRDFVAESMYKFKLQIYVCSYASGKIYTIMQIAFCVRIANVIIYIILWWLCIYAVKVITGCTWGKWTFVWAFKDIIMLCITNDGGSIPLFSSATYPSTFFKHSSML